MATVNGAIGALVLVRTTTDLTGDDDYAGVPSAPSTLLVLPAPPVDCSRPMQIEWVIELVDAGGVPVARAGATFKCKPITASPKPSSGTLIDDGAEQTGNLPGQALRFGPYQAGEQVALRIYTWANAPVGAAKANVYALVRLMPVS